MSKTKYILLIGLLLLSMLSMAEVIVLRSGQRILGEIVLQNEEVVIVRGTNGMRHQYPMNEVSGISAEEEKLEEKKSEIEEKKKTVAVRLQVMGGVLYVPQIGWGGQAGADLVMGANILEDKLFVGGTIGYRAKAIEKNAYSFIPLQISISSVLGNKHNAPTVGLNMGYGFAANTRTQSGICAGAEVGWCLEINEDTRLSLGLNTEWQQAHTDVKQTIENKTYTNYMGVNFISFGAKVVIHF